MTNHPPFNWRRVRLGEVAQVIGGGTPSRSVPENWDGDISWATPSDLTRLRGRYISKTESHLSRTGLEMSSATVLPAGSVLVTSRATIGTCAINRIPMATNQGFQNLVPGPEVCAEFLFYLMREVTPELVRVASGSTFLEVSRKSVASLEIVLPPFPEQRRIAAILSSVDEAIESTQEVLDQLQVVKKAMMAELLTRGIPGRHTRFKQTGLGEVPEAWEVGHLRDFATLSSGGTPSRDRPEFWGGGIPWVKTGEIAYGTIMRTEETISSLGLENSSAKMLPPGLLLMAMYGHGATRGRVALLGVPATVNQACLAILPSSRVLTRFLFHVFSDRYEALRELGHEGTQKNLNARLVGDVLVPVPPSAEQESIVAVLDCLGSKIECEDLYIAQLEAVRAALMSVLLTGEIRVPPDEAAP